MHRRLFLILPLFVALSVASCALIADVDPIEYRKAEHDGADAADDADVTGDDASHDQGGNHDATSCDEDGDGVPSEACGGADCDDTDPRVHPGADFSDAVPPEGRNGDWNCDGRVTKKITENLDCPSFDKDCDRYSGFTTEVPCGETASSITCFYSGITKKCANIPGTKQKQSCR